MSLDEVDFLSLVVDGSNVTGTLTRVVLSSDVPPVIQSQNTTLIGTQTGSSLALTFADPVHGTTVWTGTKNGNQLQLVYPSTDGQLGVLTFTTASVSDYNVAADSLRQSAVEPFPTPNGTPGGPNPGADSPDWEQWCVNNGFDPSHSTWGCPAGPKPTPTFADCTIAVSYHQATLSVLRTTAATAACAGLAAELNLPENGGWDSYVASVYRPASGARRTCTLAGIGTLDGTVAVDDSGAMAFGTAICDQLTLRRRPYLGVSYAIVSYQEAQRLGNQLLQGSYLIKAGAPSPAVAPGGPAANAGVQVGDVIVSLDDLSFDSHTLEEIVADHHPGDVVPMAIWRNGKTLDLMVTLSTWPSS